MNKLQAAAPGDGIDQGEWINWLLERRRVRWALGIKYEPAESQEELYSRTAKEMRAALFPKSKFDAGLEARDSEILQRKRLKA